MKRKQKLIDLRQSHFVGEFGKKWKGCRDLQYKLPVKEFDQTPFKNRQRPLSIPPQKAHTERCSCLLSNGNDINSGSC